MKNWKNWKIWGWPKAQAKKHKKLLLIVLLVVVTVFFVAGVPMIINELYKTGRGYETVIPASDVLAYYGTILGAFIAVATLSTTIIFTKKQIQRESFLKLKQQEWQETEKIISNGLERINPLAPLKKLMIMENGENTQRIKIMQAYQMDCRTPLDELLSCWGGSNSPRLAELIQEITKASEQFFNIAQEEINEQTKLGTYIEKDHFEKVLDIEKKMPKTFPEENISYCRAQLQSIDGMCLDSITNEIGKANEKMIEAYEKVYRPLLKMKQETFTSIGEEIQAEADSILHFWRK